MAEQNFFAHESPDGRSPFDRMEAAGYAGSPRSENIAAGNDTAEDTLDQWLNSDGHCANIMDTLATELGVGFTENEAATYRTFWVQNFGIGQ